MSLFLAIMTCYRLAQLVALDDGPMFVFKKFRQKLNKRAANGGQFSKSMAELFHCPFCLGMWIAVPCAVLYLWPAVIGDAFLLVVGIAGAQAFLEGRREDDA